MNIVTKSHLKGQPITDKPHKRPVRTVRWFIIVGTLLAVLVGALGFFKFVFLPNLFKEIFGNPFHRIKFDKKLRTSTVALLARGIYDERTFDQLPILADALQDADCDNDDILNHFRDPNATHVRGCWAVDLVLGKE